MSQPHEVIVYRNPLEYQLYNSGILFPIMCSVFAAIVAVFVFAKIATYCYIRRPFNKKFWEEYHNKKTVAEKLMDIWNSFIDYLPLVAGAVTAVLVFGMMTP